jgi:hypothetical protein
MCSNVRRGGGIIDALRTVCTIEACACDSDDCCSSQRLYCYEDGNGKIRRVGKLEIDDATIGVFGTREVGEKSQPTRYTM